MVGEIDRASRTALSYLRNEPWGLENMSKQVTNKSATQWADIQKSSKQKYIQYYRSLGRKRGSGEQKEREECAPLLLTFI